MLPLQTPARPVFLSHQRCFKMVPHVLRLSASLWGEAALHGRKRLWLWTSQKGTEAQVQTRVTVAVKQPKILWKLQSPKPKVWSSVWRTVDVLRWVYTITRGKDSWIALQKGFMSWLLLFHWRIFAGKQMGLLNRSEQRVKLWPEKLDLPSQRRVIDSACCCRSMTPAVKICASRNNRKFRDA